MSGSTEEHMATPIAPKDQADGAPFVHPKHHLKPVDSGLKRQRHGAVSLPTHHQKTNAIEMQSRKVAAADVEVPEAIRRTRHPRHKKRLTRQSSGMTIIPSW